MNCCTYRVKQFCVTVLIATGHLNRNDKLWPLHTLLTVCWVFFIYRIGRRHQNKNLRASVITCAEDCVLYAIILTPWRHFFHTTSHVPFACSPTACGLHVVDLLPLSLFYRLFSWWICVVKWANLLSSSPCFWQETLEALLVQPVLHAGRQFSHSQQERITENSVW